MGSETPRELILVGPFYTRREAARHSGMSPHELLTHPGILRMGGPISIQEVYAGFQFGNDGLREDLAAVVEAFGADADHWAVCDWITRPNQQLAGKSPLSYLNEGGRLPRVVAAAHS